MRTGTGTNQIRAREEGKTRDMGNTGLTVRRGGGVAALFKDVYQCKQVSFGQYLSFEYPGILLKGAPRILFIIIYRPPKYSPAFVEEFTELLSMISSEFDCFAIAGDFNIHIDNAQIKTTKEIITVLNTFDLIQHVHGPTHNRGHTLDLHLHLHLCI